MLSPHNMLKFKIKRFLVSNLTFKQPYFDIINESKLDYFCHVSKVLFISLNFSLSLKISPLTANIIVSRNVYGLKYFSILNT
jgi:hypothetical protein